MTFTSGQSENRTKDFITLAGCLDSSAELSLAKKKSCPVSYCSQPNWFLAYDTSEILSIQPGAVSVQQVMTGLFPGPTRVLKTLL